MRRIDSCNTSVTFSSSFGQRCSFKTYCGCYSFQWSKKVENIVLWDVLNCTEQKTYGTKTANCDQLTYIGIMGIQNISNRQPYKLSQMILFLLGLLLLGTWQVFLLDWCTHWGLWRCSWKQLQVCSEHSWRDKKLTV